MKHKIEGKMFSYGQMSEIWLHFPNGIFFTFHNFAKKHGAQRSELRLTASPDDNRCCDRQMLPWYVIDFRHLPRDMATHRISQSSCQEGSADCWFWKHWLSMSCINVVRRAQAQAIAPQSNKVSVSDAHVAGNATILTSVQMADFQCYFVGVVKVSV